MANSTEEITLIDAENNTEYKLVVSSEDANKARNDNLAYSLLKHARTNTNIDLDEIMISESENIDNGGATTSCNNENNMTLESKDQHIWTRSETMLFINLYKEYIAKCNKKVPAKQCWFIISKEMKDAGYEISPIKCATKFQCLKRTYKTITDHNKKSGNSRKHWEYYEIMHEIFDAKPWIEPVSTVGSGVTITNNDIENEEPKVQKKRKIIHVIENYFQDSMKKGKEINAQKRHEEKMTCLAEMKNFMMNNRGDK